MGISISSNNPLHNFDLEFYNWSLKSKLARRFLVLNWSTCFNFDDPTSKLGKNEFPKTKVFDISASVIKNLISHNFIDCGPNLKNRDYNILMEF